MRLLDKLTFALRGITGRRRHEEEMNDEMAHFLALESTRNQAAGMAPEEALRQARITLGGDQTKESVREMRPGVWLETFWQDIKFAARLLRKNPGYFAVAFITIALGIGANTAIFSLVYAVLLRPLPYANPERLAIVQTDRAGEPRAPQVSYMDLEDMRAQHSGIESAGAVLLDQFITGGDEQPMLRDGMDVTPSLFATLGVQPALGRAFLPAGATEGKDAVAILSYGLWQESYGGRSDVLGQSILLNGKPRTIVGVLPKGFEFNPFGHEFVTRGPEIYVPLLPTTRLARHRSIFAMETVVRLRAGVSWESAQAELNQISAGLAQKYPDTNTGRTLALTPLTEILASEARPALCLLMAAVGAVLLAVCVNLANLMIGRVTAREQELAVRVALGAARWRLLRQLLAESLMLVTLGGAAGTLLAWWFTPRLIAALGVALPSTVETKADPAVLGFGLALSLISGIASGLLPARSIWLKKFDACLHATARSTAGKSRSRLRKGLVVAEVTLSCVLLVGAGLLLSSFLALLNVQPGFDPARLLTFQLTLSNSRYETRAQVAQTLSDLTGNIERLPGVRRATVTGSLPMSGNNSGTEVRVEGRALAPGQQPPTARWQYVQQGYFQALGIRVQRGRDFEESDIARPHVTIISESMARTVFPGEDPIGKRVTYGPSGGNADWHEIIGIVDDVKHISMREIPIPRAYDLFGQHAGLSAFVAVRTERNASQLMTDIRAILRKLDPGAPVYSVRTMEQWIGRSVRNDRALAILVGVFAFTALFLAAVGTYGVISSLVQQRTREIGIRMALGAAPNTILKGTVGEGLRLTVLGLVLGLIASISVAPLLRGLLFGVGPADPRTFVAVALLLLVVAVAACYVPARRAAHVDPILALRQE